MLSLLPFERFQVDPGEPGVDGRPQRRLTPESRRERHVAELDAEAAPQRGKRTKLVQLAEAVQPVAGGRPGRADALASFRVNA